MQGETCVHLEQITEVKQAEKRECEECVRIGSDWLHLRTCQSCGATLCCDSSPNRHARRHAAEDGHPLIRSAEPGEDWDYCFVDDVVFELR